MNGVPESILDALADVSVSALPGTLATNGGVCEGAAYHSPTPLTLVTVQRGGGTATLCPTCASNLAVLELVGKDAGWPVLRCFGNRIRAVWERIRN